MTRALRTILLHFAAAADDSAAPDGLRGQLSAVRQAGPHLWLASDEMNSVERLSRTGDGAWGEHRMVPLDALMPLPGGPEEEIDIEGMDFDGGYLWVVGSHGLKRRKPRPKKEAAREIGRLAELRADGNRYLLARYPTAEADGEWTLCEGEEGGRRPARLAGGDRGNVLTEALRFDPHLAPFLAIPSKDNGFDVEGLAVRGDRVFLGLRGPVLRGWAVVLELAVEEEAPGLLRLARIGPGRQPYRKHFLDLRGLGVRDLCLHGDDLLILAGPTMDLDGPAAVYRWAGALDAEEEQLLGKDALEEVVGIPYGTGEHAAFDHPEGLTLFWEDGATEPALLVVYDSPDSRRMHGDAAVHADVFPLG